MHEFVVRAPTLLGKFARWFFADCHDPFSAVAFRNSGDVLPMDCSLVRLVLQSRSKGIEPDGAVELTQLIIDCLSYLSVAG